MTITSIAIDALLAAQSLFIFLFAGYEYITLMHFPALPNQKAAEPGRPFVSIILPVRNQAKTVEACVSSLTQLDYAEKEIIIVDGGSTDGTRDQINRYADSVRIVDEDPLPEGWVGKNWACNQGYRQAKGELLLFTDGDSIHGIDSLARSVGYLQSEKADMVTLAPGTILRTFWEKVLQPPIFLLIMILVGGKLVNDDKRKKNAIGNGQYMLFTREAYEKIGGHAAVKNKIVEDYNMARLLKKAGMRLRFVTGQDVLGVRMYASVAEIWRGWRKNFYTVSDSHALSKALTRIVLMLTFLVLPFFILGYGITQAVVDPFNPFLVAGAFMSFLLWLGIIILDRSINISPAYALLFPAAILIYIGIGIDATIRAARGMGFDWKGRTYGKPIETQLDPTPVQEEIIASR